MSARAGLKNKKKKSKKIWDQLDTLVPYLDQLRQGTCPVEKAKDICRGLGLEWFGGIATAEMEKIIWYLLINTDCVGRLIDEYDKNSPAPEDVAKKLELHFEAEIRLSKDQPLGLEDEKKSNLETEEYSYEEPSQKERRRSKKRSRASPTPAQQKTKQSASRDLDPYDERPQKKFRQSRSEHSAHTSQGPKTRHQHLRRRSDLFSSTVSPQVPAVIPQGIPVPTIPPVAPAVITVKSKVKPKKSVTSDLQFKELITKNADNDGNITSSNNSNNDTTDSVAPTINVPRMSRRKNRLNIEEDLHNKIIDNMKNDNPPTCQSDEKLMSEFQSNPSNVAPVSDLVSPAETTNLSKFRQNEQHKENQIHRDGSQQSSMDTCRTSEDKTRLVGNLNNSNGNFENSNDDNDTRYSQNSKYGSDDDSNSNLNSNDDNINEDSNVNGNTENRNSVSGEDNYSDEDINETYKRSPDFEDNNEENDDKESAVDDNFETEQLALLAAGVSPVGTVSTFGSPLNAGELLPKQIEIDVPKRAEKSVENKIAIEMAQFPIEGNLQSLKPKESPPKLEDIESNVMMLFSRVRPLLNSESINGDADLKDNNDKNYQTNSNGNTTYCIDNSAFKSANENNNTNNNEITHKNAHPNHVAINSNTNNNFPNFITTKKTDNGIVCGKNLNDFNNNNNNYNNGNDGNVNFHGTTKGETIEDNGDNINLDINTDISDELMK